MATATRAVAVRRRRPAFVRARRRSAKMTVPLAVVAGFAPLGIRAVNGYHANGWIGAADGVTSGLSGYSVFSKKFEMDALAQGLVPIVAGFLVHWGASRLGINRALGRARVPFLRL